MICPKCKKGVIVIKEGKFGHFKACDQYPTCKNIVGKATKAEFEAFQELKNSVRDSKHKDGFNPTSFVVLDLETTGLSKDFDEIIEIGLIKYEDLKIVDKMGLLFKPKKKISEKITQITGISNEDVEDCNFFYEHLPEIMGFIGNYPVIGHNIQRFDAPFFKAKLAKVGISLDNEIIDTLFIAKTYYEFSKNNLETIKEYLKITIDSHRAVNDCFVTGEFYIHYIKNKVLKKM